MNTEIRNTVNKLFGILCLIPAVNFLTAIISGIISGIVMVTSGGSASEFFLYIAVPQYLLPIFSFIVFFALKKLLKIKSVPIQKFNKKIPMGEFISIFLLFLGATVVFEIISVINNLFFYLIGIELPDLSFFEYIDTSPTGIIMLIIVLAVLPAIAEELIYRYGVSSSLSEYSVSGAIIVSSLAFGLMHGTFQQLMYAIFAGLFFGYLLFRTQNIKLTVFLHFLTNFISCIMLIIQIIFGEKVYLAAMLIETVLFIAAGIVGACLFFGNYGLKIKNTESRYKAADILSAMFKAPFFYVFTALCFFLMIINLGIIKF